MSNDSEKEGIVIDVVPDPEPEPQPEPERLQRQIRKPPGGLGVVLTVGLVGALLVLLGLGYWWGGRLRSDLDQLNGSLQKALQAQQQLESAVSETRGALAAQQAQLDRQQNASSDQTQVLAEQKAAFELQTSLLADERRRMAQREAELGRMLNEVQSLVGRSPTQWMVAEAEYLMRLAQERLGIARDLITAQAALELADERLRETSDPGWGRVRDQLAREIAAVAAVRLPDYAGLDGRLKALGEHIGKLKPKGLRSADTAAAAEQAAADTTEQDAFDRLWSDLKQGLQNAVRIRRTDQPIAALPPPGGDELLGVQIASQLETASLALARHDSAGFAAQLRRVIGALEQWYDLGDPAVAQISQSLRDLAGIDLEPQMPDISGSLRLLRETRSLQALTRPENQATP